jgi:TorA maturation chaperone TorD
MDMSNFGRQPANQFWSGIYAQLSEFFKEPSAEFAEDVASGRLAHFFDESLRLLGLDPAPGLGLTASGDVRAQLDREYRRLFIGPLPPYIVPVESVFKKWTADPNCHLPMAQEKGLLMGDSAVDMMRRYQAEGIEIPDALGSMPDHAALLFEYMAHLASCGDENACKEFMVGHLDWLDDLAREIEDSGIGGVYVRGALIAAMIAHRHAIDLTQAR